MVPSSYHSGAAQLRLHKALKHSAGIITSFIPDLCLHGHSLWAPCSCSCPSTVRRTKYLICGAQCKVKTQRSASKKQGKSTIKGIRYKISPFFHEPPFNLSKCGPRPAAQHHLGAHSKCRSSGPIPDPGISNFGDEPSILGFDKCSRGFCYAGKLENNCWRAGICLF